MNNRKKKNTVSKKEKEPIVKTRVKRDNSIEVELKNPANTLIGKIFVYILVIGMAGGSLFGLIYLLIEALNK